MAKAERGVVGVVKAEKASICATAWSSECYEFAQKARGLNLLRVGTHIAKLQQMSNRPQRDCVMLIHRCMQDNIPRRPWSEAEIDQVRELLVTLSVEQVAKKTGRSYNAVKSLCRRLSISAREVRSDLFSTSSLASAMGVPKSEILFWIEQGWLVQSKTELESCRISPEALHRCLRVHQQAIMKRNVKAHNLIRAFYDFCYVPKHTEDKQLLDVREGQRLKSTGADAAGIN